MKLITLVTGFWNFACDDLSQIMYKKNFKQLLKCDANLCIYTDKSNEEFIWKYRNETNTKIFFKELSDFKTWFEFFPLIKKIKTNAGWQDQSIEMYNLIMLSKMFLLHDIKIINPFNSCHFFWINANITENIDKEHIRNHAILDNLLYYSEYQNKFIILSRENKITNGIDQDKLAKYYSIEHIEYICNGILFGGKDCFITQVNNLYYNYLNQTLNNNLLGSGECLLTIISHKYQEYNSQF